MQLSFCVCCYVHIVRYENDCVTFGVQVSQQLHDGIACMAVEIARWFVG